ncbi:MAG: hypothetical protein H7X83_12350 [Verrucomicrobia bacterium]|nr:hypothetical protein [Deltaproteobacteria bacterium]
MAVVRIICPKCGLSKDVAAERIPATGAQVTCPVCKHRFPLSNESKQVTAVVNPGPTLKETTAAPAASQSSGMQADKSPIRDMQLQQAGNRAKSLLLFFLLLVVVLVGIRLWAEGKKRDVPFPNFIATSTQGVAVSWGEEVIMLDHAGRVTGRQRLPKGTMLTQLLYVDDELWLADHTSNSIRRLRNSSWETVVNGGDRFRGAFKFAVDQKSGEMFVTDSSNHTIHQFMTDGRYIRSFGREGKNPGELKFPNSILFDRDGNLIVVNTNCFRIDLFSRQGEFLKTIANVEAVSNYKYPTLLAKVGDRFAFLNTMDLRQSVIMLYGDDGHAIGQLSPMTRIDEAGDVAAWDGKVLVTENKLRKIFLFSADDQEYLGTFSRELDDLGKEADRLEARYAAISKYSLIALLVFCLPVFYLYYQTRQNQERKLDAVDYGSIVPRSAILSVATDRKKLAFAALILIISVLFTLLCIPSLRNNSSLMPFLMLVNAAFTLVLIRFVMESGVANPSRKEQVEKLVRAASSSLAQILAAGEQVEACTALQRNVYLKQPSLLLLTSQRLLLIDFAALRPSGYIQLGYGDIASITLEPAKIGITALNRLLKVEMFRLKLPLRHPGDVSPLQLAGVGSQILEQIKRLLEEKVREGSSLGYARLCTQCFCPLGPDGCPHCRQSRKADWKPLLFSLLYPGLGQFYNREIKKGSAFSVSFTIGILSLTGPFTQILDRSAETSKETLIQIVYFLLVMTVMYIVALADADLVGRKGRRLFSMDIFKRIRK